MFTAPLHPLVLGRELQSDVAISLDFLTSLIGMRFPHHDRIPDWTQNKQTGHIQAWDNYANGVS